MLRIMLATFINASVLQLTDELIEYLTLVMTLATLTQTHCNSEHMCDTYNGC